jgi:uncharacterized protein (DUF58 family)
MDFSNIRRRRPRDQMPAGVYANLEDLIRIRFRVKDFSLRPRQPVTSVLSGRYGSRLRGRGLDFEELRRYRPGDDVRSIDWRVTARTRTAHTRVFSEEKDRAVMIVIDQRMNMFFGTRRQLKSVSAAELAALIAWRAYDSGDRIGAVLFNDEQVTVLPPRRSEGQVMDILHGVLAMNHALSADATAPENPGQLNSALEAAARHAPHDVLVVMVSDFFGADATSGKWVANLATHNDVLGVLVYDPLRRNPGRRRLRVGNGSQQLDIDLADTALRQRLVDDYAREHRMLTRFMRRLSAPLLNLSTEQDTATQVRRMLGVPGG